MAITHILLPESLPVQPLPFYLTMEEWLARNAGPQEMFFMWQVRPTVIFGRNQEFEKEVNAEYCREHGIEFYRRKSGGGCVFADMDNIMFSYIKPSDAVQTTFSDYSRTVAAMLRSLGLDAEAGGRNDVMIGRRKVSGNAFYHIPGRSIVHGTMLFSTNMTHMLNAITPSRSKLESKKVQSVASHITTIAEHLPSLSIEEFKRKAAEYMTSSSRLLSDADVEAIREMSRPYYTRRWIEGTVASAAGMRPYSERVEGVGEFTVGLMIDSNTNRISDINIQGDFFIMADLDSVLLDKLRGIEATPESVSAALAATDVSQVIAGMSTDVFRALIIRAVESAAQN